MTFEKFIEKWGPSASLNRDHFVKDLYSVLLDEIQRIKNYEQKQQPFKITRKSK